MAKTKDEKTTEKTTLAVEVIVDNSGSMGSIKNNVVEGINKFIDELATAIVPARLGVTLYDDCLRASLIDGVSVAEQPRMKVADYPAHWGTENIAHSVIQALEKRLAPVNARHKVLVVITDGLSNSADEPRAKALIAKRRAEGWRVIWLGIYMEAWHGGGYDYKDQLLNYAKKLGIPDAVTFAMPAGKFDKIMPLAATVALRFVATGGDEEASAFTKEERALAGR